MGILTLYEIMHRPSLHISVLFEMHKKHNIIKIAEKSF